MPCTPDMKSSNFNSRAHARRDLPHGFYSHPFHHFNSRAHARRDGKTYNSRNRIKNFNSRAHARRDKKSRKRLAAQYHFNSRAHARRDRSIFFSACILLKFQLTRPRKARQHCPCVPHELPWISTHAPTQGATEARSFA